MRRQAARHRGQHCRVKLAGLGGGRVEPVCPVLTRDHHGHAIVDLADIVGCLGRDNRGRPQPGALVIVGHRLVPPELVDSGEGEGSPVRSVNKVRLLTVLAPVRDGLPLVVAIGREDAPALGEGPPVGRLDRHRLGPGVDHPPADRGLLGPGGHQAPADHAQLTGLWLVLAGRPFEDREDPLGGGDVVVRGRLRVGRGSHAVALHAELLEELKALTRRHKTTTHAIFLNWMLPGQVPLSLDWQFITTIRAGQTPRKGGLGGRVPPGSGGSGGSPPGLALISTACTRLTTRTGPGLPRPPPGRSEGASSCRPPSPSPTGPWSWPRSATGRPGSPARCGPGTPNWPPTPSVCWAR